MRLLLTGGGTAGHINPALAIAETVKQNDPTAEIAFVGVRGKREEDLVPRAGYPLYFVRAKGFSGKLPTPSNLHAAWLAYILCHVPCVLYVLIRPFPGSQYRLCTLCIANQPYLFSERIRYIFSRKPPFFKKFSSSA